MGINEGLQFPDIKKGSFLLISPAANIIMFTKALPLLLHEYLQRFHYF
jgi:hypothetical protein